MPFTNSPNMQLPLPTVSQEPGPQFASDVNQALSIIDSHTHGPNNGVPIGSQGINIQSDFPFNVNNATSLRTVRFISTTASSGTDVGCVYVRGVDLFYNDLNGNVIPITANAGLSTTAIFNGNISTTAITSANGTAASSGFIRMVNNKDFLSWRNAAGNADDRIYFDNNDILQVIGGGIAVQNGGVFGTGQGTVPLKSNASSGIIGEFLYAQFNASQNTPLATSGNGGAGQGGTVLNLLLSVGDWDLTAVVQFGTSAYVGSGTGIITLSQYPGATNPDGILGLNQVSYFFSSSGSIYTAFGVTATIPTYRLSTSANTNVYIYAQSPPGAGNLSITGGRIQARRMR